LLELELPKTTLLQHLPHILRGKAVTATPGLFFILHQPFADQYYSLWGQDTVNFTQSWMHLLDMVQLKP
jgi:hypothetical protein